MEFWASCFLSSSFLSYALQVPANDFARRVVQHIGKQSPDSFAAMAFAAGYLVLCEKTV